jgi:hypothetical protein
MRASSLLAVLFASMTLGICAPLFAGDGMPACCAQRSDDASFTVCCRSGDELASEVPIGARTLLPPVAITAFQIASPATARHENTIAPLDTLPYRSADRQALLSTFLI